MLQGRRAFIATALALLPLLASCRPPWRYFILNNTGAAIEIISSKFEMVDPLGKVRSDTWDRWEPWPMVIRANAGRHVHTGGGGVWHLRIRANNCLLTYALPPDGDWLSRADPLLFSRSAAALQLEADGLLYIVPVRGDPPGPMPLAQFADAQPPGFPAAPAERRCAP